jgi:hypothetical protein
MLDSWIHADGSVPFIVSSTILGLAGLMFRYLLLRSRERRHRRELKAIQIMHARTLDAAERLQTQQLRAGLRAAQLHAALTVEQGESVKVVPSAHGATSGNINLSIEPSAAFAQPPLPELPVVEQPGPAPPRHD